MKRKTIFYYLCAALVISCTNRESAGDRDGIEDGQGYLIEPVTQERIRINTADNPHITIDTATINRHIADADTFSNRNAHKAKAVLIDALRHSLQINYNEGIVRALTKLGKGYLKNSPDTALIYYYKAMVYANKRSGQLRIKSQLYNNIGVAYLQLDKKDSAAYYFYQAAYLLEQKDMQSHVKDEDDIIYLNLVRYWTGMYENDKVKLFLDRARTIATLRKDTKRLLTIDYHTANMYFNQDRYDTAMILYKRLLQHPLSDSFLHLHANLAIGDLYCWKNTPENSFPYYETAYRLSLASNDQLSILNARLKLGEAYFLTENYHTAKPIILEVIKTAKKMENKLILEFAYQYLAAIYDKQNDYKAANETRANLIAIREASYPKEVKEIATKLDVQYRVSEKDKLLAQKQLQLTRQQSQLREKNLWIGIITISSSLFLVFGAGLYRSYKRRKHLHEKQLQLLQQEQQINQLRAVMTGEEQERIRIARELHDGVGGMLAAIKMNVSRALRKDDSDNKTASLNEVLHLVENTADEVRKTAHNLMPDILNKHSLPQALRMYCDNVNTGNSLEIDLQFHLEWQSLTPSFELSLYRMIQEIIQNIIKHAQATHAVIQFRQEDDTLFITAEDDGKGFNTNEAAFGLGLHNLTSRTATLDGHVSIESSPGRGTTCFMELPLEKHRNINIDGNQS